MTRDQLVKRLAASTDLSQAEVGRVLRALEAELVLAVRAGDPVPLGRVGTIATRWRDGRTLRSVADSRRMYIDGHFAVQFRPGRQLRDAAAARTPQRWRDPRHQAAWRVAETLIGDLALYHRERAPGGLPADDVGAEAALRAAFGDAWAHARRAWDARVPEPIRSECDHLLRSARSRWASSPVTV